jgi:hypothetical protein
MSGPVRVIIYQAFSEERMPRMTAVRLRRTDRIWFLVAIGLALVLFLATLQTTINGSHSAYTTDTGEIQNALPRWGTIHWTGYPQYSLTGSLFVTLLRAVGISPAAGASLVSAFWATVAIGLLVLLARDLGACIPAAVIGAWFVAVSTSVWMNASLAEVHSLTLVLTIASLVFAVRFGRIGQRRDLLLLTLAFTQGIVHQRAVVLIAPAIVVLIYPHWRAILQHLVAVISVALIAPITYLYLPARVLMGAKWTFGQIGSWHGLWVMLTDNRAERIVELPTTMNEWLDRARFVATILNDDLPWSLIGLGLLSLLLVTWSRSRREALGLTLGWIPYVGLSLLIWVGRVGDAVLAAKLPILPFVGLGLALLLDAVSERLTGLRGETKLRVAGVPLLLVVLAALVANHYPEIKAVTGDSGAEETINMAEQVAPPSDGQPTVLMALWGHDYWALAYAQAYQDRLPGLTLVDHNANLRDLVSDGYRVWTLSKSFYVNSMAWWKWRLGPEVALSTVSPGVVQIDVVPQMELTDLPAGPSLDLENGIWIAYADVSEYDVDQLLVTIVWQAIHTLDRDYSVAIHLVAHDPAREPEDVLATSDRKHPVDGWYPTSDWTTGEYVIDHYVIDMVSEPRPVAVRVAMYHRRDDGTFVNSPWLSLPIPP